MPDPFAPRRRACGRRDLHEAVFELLADERVELARGGDAVLERGRALEGVALRVTDREVELAGVDARLPSAAVGMLEDT